MSLRFGHSEPQNNNNSHTNACMQAQSHNFFLGNTHMVNMDIQMIDLQKSLKHKRLNMYKE